MGLAAVSLYTAAERAPRYRRQCGVSNRAAYAGPIAVLLCSGNTDLKNSFPGGRPSGLTGSCPFSERVIENKICDSIP